MQPIVPFGGYLGTPDLSVWQQIPRPDGGGYMPFGLMGHGMAPLAGQAAPMPSAKVPAPTHAPDNSFSDTPWFDPYGMRYSLTSLLLGGSGQPQPAPSLLGGGGDPRQSLGLMGLLGGRY